MQDGLIGHLKHSFIDVFGTVRLAIATPRDRFLYNSFWGITRAFARFWLFILAPDLTTRNERNLITLDARLMMG